jgi:hypothetical protein
MGRWPETGPFPEEGNRKTIPEAADRMGCEYLRGSALLHARTSRSSTDPRSAAGCRRDPVSGDRLWRDYNREIRSRKKLR